MPSHISYPPTRQVTRNRLFEVFRDADLVDLFETVLYNTGTALPGNTATAQETAEFGVAKASRVQQPVRSDEVPRVLQPVPAAPARTLLQPVRVAFAPPRNFQPPVAYDVANLTGGVAGAIPYQTAPDTTGFSAAGSAGQVLLSGGAGAPTWTTGTLALAGNFATVGAFAVTMTFTGATGVTFPTAGTLATLAGAESLMNKKLGSLTTNGFVQTSGGDGTLSVLAPAANIATFLATPSSANLAAAVTDETGTGALVFANTPTFATPILGTPNSGTLTNCTGLPISSGVSGLGANVATALGVAVGTDGAFVVKGGALGSPSSAGTMPAYTLGGTVTLNGQTFSGAASFNNVIALGQVAAFPTAGLTHHTNNLVYLIGGSGGWQIANQARSKYISLDDSASTITIRASSGADTAVFSSTGAAISGRVGLPSYTVATLPAVGSAGGMIYVSNESGGAVPAFSDATNWRRVTDRAIVS